MNKLLVFPLIVLFFVAILAQAGLSPQNFGAYGYTDPQGWYDEDGHMVAYSNGSAVNDAGWVESSTYGNNHRWQNGTGVDDLYDVTQGIGGGTVTFGFDFFGAVGFFAVIAGIMALAIIMGVRVLSSGMAGETIKIVVFGTALSGIWIVLSVPAFNLITAIPLIGFIAYGVLTIMYGMGAIFQLSGSGGDDL